MQKAFSIIFGISLISASQIFGQVSQTKSANNPALKNLVITSRAVDSRVVENLLAAYDEGDSFSSPGGRRSLRRLPGAVAVQVAAGAGGRAALESLMATGGALEGHERAAVGKGGFVWLKGGAAERELQSKDRTALAAKIRRLRQTAGVLTANPVFIEPASGLWAITTDEIIVALKPGVDAQDYFGGDWANVKPLFAPLGQYVVKVSSAESEAIFAEVNRRAADARVAWAEPNFISQGLHQLLPNDPQFPNQWALRNTGQTGGTSGADIKATAAWDRTTGSSSVIVAILDTGFDLTHPDLVGNIATNAQEVAGNGLDDDNNGYVDDVRGWDFFGSDNDPNPNTAFDNHGTAVAGVAIAAANNALGMAGVAFGCRWLPLRIGESSTAGSFTSRDSDIANALYYAAGTASWRGADVIVMSFESFQAAVVDSALTFATEQGRSGRGCPAFVAMGNHGDNWRTLSLNGFPAGTFSFEWKYAKNGSVVDGEDAVWMAEVDFPGGAVERFDGGTFPPAGWTTSGDAGWTHAADPAHAYAASLFTARSGVIGNNQSSSLLTTRAVSAGNLTYTYWVSSEAGGDIFSISLNGTVQTGANQSGAPFIRSGPSYPATHTNVTTIGASTHWDTRASYSQIGGKIDLLAPGGAGGGASIITTDRVGVNGDNTATSPAGDYEYTQGTSLANPIAAGIGALMLSVTPSLTARQVRDILRATADKVGPVPYTNGWNPYYGAGRANASNAVALAWAPSCLGIPLIVTSLADSGLGTLRDAIDRVNAAGCPGTISLAVTGVINLASSLPVIGPGTVIIGPGTNQLTINGGGVSAVFAVGTGTNKVSGLRFANAYSTNAGASVSSSGYTVIENCAFSNSVTIQSFGGAVASLPGTASLFVTNCVLIHNTVRGGDGESRPEGSTSGGGGGGGTGLGGAIYSGGPQLVLHGCAFIGNAAFGGNGGNGGGNQPDQRGGNGGYPNRGLGGSGLNVAGGNGGFGGGGGGGGALALGGAGGFGGGGGGGGARGSGGTGGAGGAGGLNGGAGGTAQFSFAGGGGGGAGLGGALFTSTGTAAIVNCSFVGNFATNGTGGTGSFGQGIGQPGQGLGGALFNRDAKVTLVNSTFSGNDAATGDDDVSASTLVTTLADSGPGSLRQALCNAAIRPGADTITFAPNLSGGVIQLTSTQLVVGDISGPVTITAANLPDGLTVSGGGARRLFNVSAGTTLTLEGLSLADGNCANQGATGGGAVVNFGDLTLRQCILRNNRSPQQDGGAVDNRGGLTADASTFVDNSAHGSGGAIASPGAVTVGNSTFARNTATNTYGGAIYALQAASVQHSTILSNSAGMTGGGILFETSASQRLLWHCVVAGNTAPKAPEVSLNAASAFFNAVGSSDGLTNGVDGNIVGPTNAPLNPLLGPLQKNAGPTPTFYPLPGSPVIDAGDPAFIGTGLLDQRGQLRVWSGRVDIGAVEFVPAGYALTFDGVDDFLILSNAALSLPTNEITIEYWERVETLRDQFSFILFPDVTSNRVSFSSLRIGPGTYWDFGDLFNGGRVVYSTPPETLNNWTHWAVVSSRANNAMRIYRNGTLDASSATNRSFVNYAGALLLGARLDSQQEFFKGQMDEFRIWSVARTPAEIQAGMRGSPCLPQPNLWVYWKFDEASGTTVLDHSGNGRHATLVNGPSRSVSFAPLLGPGTPAILRISPTQVRVTWTPNAGCLQSASDVAGPWTDTLGATNGQIIAITPTNQFFRTTQ